jgi:hypothetical protein
MKKSINGYFKFYNGSGIPCRIKCQGEVKGTALIKFKHKDTTDWMYHVPNKKFRNCLEVVNFILKNLENKEMIFKIISMQESIGN